MNVWTDIEIEPAEDVELILKLSDGTETTGFLVGPPPIEIDPSQSLGGWMVDVSHRSDLDYDIVAWRYKKEQSGE